MFSVYCQTSAETAYTGENTPGGKCAHRHAKVTRCGWAVLFIYVASDGTVCWQYNPTADILPEIHHVCLGNRVGNILSHYPKHKNVTAVKMRYNILVQELFTG